SGEIFFLTQRDRLVELAARHAVPTIYAFREFPVAGGLISYGADFAEPYRLLGGYAGRSPGSTGHQSRAGYQSENRQDPRPCHTASVAWPCRPGDRITTKFRYWPLADIPLCTANVYFRGKPTWLRV